MVDCNTDMAGCIPDEAIEPPFELNHHLGSHWVKVDPNNPEITSIREFKEYIEEGEEDGVDPKLKEVDNYFLEQCEKNGFVMIDRPYFSSKEEVDRFVEIFSKPNMDKYLDERSRMSAHELDDE